MRGRTASQESAGTDKNKFGRGGYGVTKKGTKESHIVLNFAFGQGLEELGKGVKTPNTQNR